MMANQSLPDDLPDDRQYQTRGLNQSEIILKYSMTFQAPAERAMVPTGTFALVQLGACYLNGSDRL